MIRRASTNRRNLKIAFRRPISFRAFRAFRMFWALMRAGRSLQKVAGLKCAPRSWFPRVPCVPGIAEILRPKGSSRNATQTCEHSTHDLRICRWLVSKCSRRLFLPFADHFSTPFSVLAFSLRRFLPGAAAAFCGHGAPSLRRRAGRPLPGHGDTVPGLRTKDQIVFSPGLFFPPPPAKVTAIMQFRTYRNTDLTVSAVGFGLWTISTGWWGQFTEGEAIALMHRAFDLGVTLFDAPTPTATA